MDEKKPDKKVLAATIAEIHRLTRFALDYQGDPTTLGIALFEFINRMLSATFVADRVPQAFYEIMARDNVFHDYREGFFEEMKAQISGKFPGGGASEDLLEVSEGLLAVSAYILNHPDLLEQQE